MVGEGDGLTVIARLEAGPSPQALLPFTVTGPDVFPRVTVMELVLLPAVIMDPAGTVHVYPVAPAIVPTEYTFPVLYPHAVVGPVIAPGAGGAGQLVVVNVMSLPLEVPTLFNPFTL
jgi:hypothetical protein